MIKYLFHSKIKLFALVISKILMTLVLLYSSFLIRDLTNIAMSGEDKSKLLFILYMTIALVVAMALITACSSLLVNRYTAKIKFNLQKDFCERLLHSPYSSICKRDSAAYMSLVSNDINIVHGSYFFEYLSMIDSSIMIVGAFISVAIINFYIALVMVAISLLLGIFPLIYKRYLSEAQLAYAQSLEDFTTEFKNDILGVDVIKVYGAEDLFAKKIEVANKNVLKKTVHSGNVNIAMGTISNTVANILKFSLMIGAGFLAFYKKLDAGAIAAIIMLSGSFYSPIMSFASEVADILSTKPVRKRLAEILLMNDEDKTSNSLQGGDIVVSDLTFGYNETRKILDNVSIKFEKGKKYLLIGASGSGKSTLLKLLTKMYEDYSGNIVLDGVNYNEITQSDLTSAITFCQQNTYLFDMSLKENILLGRAYDESRMSATLSECQLDEYVNKLPKGIDTMVGQELNRTSEGEKLRINLARALYRGNDIILLDEVTASLDPANTAEIEKIIFNLKGKTVVAICHKITVDVLQNYDEIIVMDNGTISMRGNYSNLKINSEFQDYINRISIVKDKSQTNGVTNEKDIELFASTAY